MPGRLRPVLLCAALPSGAQAGAGELSGRVIAVRSDAILDLLDATGTRHRIRLGDIEAPVPGQPREEASRASLARRVAGKEARVEFHGFDRQQRTVGKVWMIPFVFLYLSAEI